MSNITTEFLEEEGDRVEPWRQGEQELAEHGSKEQENAWKVSGEEVGKSSEQGFSGREEGDISRAKTLNSLKTWQQTLILALREQPHVALACSKARVSRKTAYETRDHNLVFRELWDEAVESHVDTAEYSLYDLGTKGDVRRTYKGGELVSEDYRRDSQALKFFLSGNRPQKYRENSAPQVTVNVLNWSNGGAELPKPVLDVEAERLEDGQGLLEVEE